MGIEDIFPNLKASTFRVTSEYEPRYNCIAWAAGRNDDWWEPDEDLDHYWPPGIDREYTIFSLVMVFKSLNYTECQDRGLESGFEKIAIYGKGRDYTHAARQLDNGKWVSKLGKLEDIEHDHLEGLEDDDYGKVVVIMKRPKQ
jgi:hypothetical protein